MRARPSLVLACSDELGGFKQPCRSGVDGHDREAIHRAIVAAKAETGRPSLICCKTVIGKGSPNKAGSHEAHGAALGDKEIAATRAAIAKSLAGFFEAGK